MAGRFDIDAIRQLNPPRSVFSKLGIPHMVRGDRIKADCPGCGKSNKFDFSISKQVYSCFGGGCEFGHGRAGIIDFVMDVLNRDFVEACKFLGGEKDLTDAEKQDAAKRQRMREAAVKKAENIRLRRTRKHMEKILDQCQPGEGSLAQTYLETRGHARGIKALGWPTDLMFHPGLEAFVGDGDDKCAAGTFPALISKGRNASGKLVLLHRTYLQPAPDGGMMKAAPVLPDHLADDWNAKQMVGVLSRCDSGVFLGATPDVTHDPTLPVLVAEGIESTLALATAGVSGAFYAALSLDRVIGRPSSARRGMEGWRPPEAGRPIIIAADNDLSPVPPAFPCGLDRAQSLFSKAKSRLAELDFAVEVVFPPAGCDPEDWLTHRPENQSVPAPPDSAADVEITVIKTDKTESEAA